MTHYLKTWPEPFQATWDGIKPFEWRRNDRQFKVGDGAFLAEFRQEEEEFTGRIIGAIIPFVLSEGFALPPGYCIFTLSRERMVRRHMDASWLEEKFKALETALLQPR